MSKDNVIGYLIFGIVIGFFSCYLFLIITEMTYVHGKKYMQSEAVKHNAAHWEVTTDGTPVFKWNSVPNETL